MITQIMNRLSVITILTLGPVAMGSAQDQQDNARGLQTATFAGGCFWSLELPDDELDGVVDTISGYAG